MFAFREAMIMDICNMIGNPDSKLSDSHRWHQVAVWLADRLMSVPENKKILVKTLTLQHFLNA